MPIESGLAGICRMDTKPDQTSTRQILWQNDLKQRRQDIFDIMTALNMDRLSCIRLFRSREPSHLLSPLCFTVRRALLTLNVYTCDDEKGDPTLPAAWLYRLCLPSVQVANPPDPSVADEHLKRGYYSVLTQTLLSLSVLYDAYQGLFVIATSPPIALELSETEWIMRALKVVS